MNRGSVIVLIFCLLLAACKQSDGSVTPDVSGADEVEDCEAKAMLQGIWLESETEELSFRAVGDTIYYPDSTLLPSYFRIVNDSLCLGDNRYAIIKQTDNLFCFQNQAGDEMRLVKSNAPEDSLEFFDGQPEILAVTEVVKRDSVVYYGGEHYHWYVAVNPTKYRVTKTTYNDEGVGVENVYFDNIIHVSLYRGAACLFSRDFKKQMFSKDVPSNFLEQAVLGNMRYSHTDARGMHFNATLCIPDGASCYMVDTQIGFDGNLSMKLLEF